MHIPPAGALPPPWSGLGAPERRITVDEVRRACASLPPPTVRGFATDRTGLWEAATMLPIVDVDGEAAAVATKRPATMRYHRDDWVFPGGRVDPDDASAADAARRELSEELGVPPQRVEVVGQLDSYTIMTGYRIDTFVGLVDDRATLRPDPREVAAVAVLPLAELLSPGRAWTHTEVPEHDTGPAMFERPAGAREMGALHFFSIRPGELLWGTQGDLLWQLFEHVLRVR